MGNAPLPASPLGHGDVVRNLRVISTPGHTEGHVSFLHSESTLLVGDLVGSRDGHVVRAPAAFTADIAQADQSIRKIAGIDARRVLFAHGAEVAEPMQMLRALLDA